MRPSLNESSKPNLNLKRVLLWVSILLAVLLYVSVDQATTIANQRHEVIESYRLATLSQNAVMKIVKRSSHFCR